MQLALSGWIRMSLAALFVLFMCASARAQEPPIDELADQMAAALSQAKLKTVIVFDFDGPYEMDVVGQKLAEDFRVALTKSGKGLQVQDRSELLELVKKNDLVPANVRDAGTEQWLAGQTELDAWISGTLSKRIGGLRITVEGRCIVKSCDRFYKFETLIPLTDDLKALVGENKKENDEFSSLPRPEKEGYSSPACIYCPNAQFTAEASRRKFSGTTLLEITVSEDGHARDIRVKVGLPFGLTQAAIDAVKEWRFQPATGPDGKPAAVRMRVEMMFGSY